jgi:hypothetical protein
MMYLSGSGNYTLPSIRDGMTKANAPSNTEVEIPSKVCDAWCGSEPMPSIWFMPLSVASIPIYGRNTSILKWTRWAGVRRHREGQILEDKYVIIDI